MSRTDSETKPVGALWVIAGFTAAENHSEPDAKMPCHPWSRAGCCQASRGRWDCLAEPLQPGRGSRGLGELWLSRAWGSEVPL